MLSEELQTAVETLEPELRGLAEGLGKTPEAVLRSAVDRYKEEQLAALDKVVARAEASGFETVLDTKKEAEEIMAEGRQRLGL